MWLVTCFTILKEITVVLFILCWFLLYSRLSFLALTGNLPIIWYSLLFLFNWLFGEGDSSYSVLWG